MTIKNPQNTARYEFISPTQKPIYKVSKEALNVRKIGIQNLRNTLAETSDLTFKSELISAMNFSVSECTRELSKRAAKTGVAKVVRGAANTKGRKA
jgi:hypothetical protein